MKDKVIDMLLNDLTRVLENQEMELGLIDHHNEKQFLIRGHADSNGRLVFRLSRFRDMINIVCEYRNDITIIFNREFSIDVKIDDTNLKIIKLVSRLEHNSDEIKGLINKLVEDIKFNVPLIESNMFTDIDWNTFTMGNNHHRFSVIHKNGTVLELEVTEDIDNKDILLFNFGRHVYKTGVITNYFEHMLTKEEIKEYKDELKPLSNRMEQMADLIFNFKHSYIYNFFFSP